MDSMRERAYAVVIFRDGDGYSVIVPALPGCFSQGRTAAEAESNAREAIELHLEGLAAAGQPIPEGDWPRTQIARVVVAA